MRTRRVLVHVWWVNSLVVCGVVVVGWWLWGGGCEVVICGVVVCGVVVFGVVVCKVVVCGVVVCKVVVCGVVVCGVVCFKDLSFLVC